MKKVVDLLKKKWLIYGGVALLAVLYVLLESVNLSPLYFEGALFWCILITIYVAIYALQKFGEFSFQQGKNPFHYVPNQKFPRWVKVLLLAPWLFLVVFYVFSSPLISWRAYRDQLGEPQTSAFTSDIQAVDTSQIPVVDQELAYTLAQKKLGDAEQISLGSQVTLGEPTIQMVNEELVWVVPLYHSGFFQWITNLEGTPGYIVVSATNEKDVRYVDNHPIKYQPNSYLWQKLDRYTRFTSAPFTGITDYSFELDDSGQPYWIVTTYSNKRGFSLPEATGVILVNATTGEHHRYALGEQPQWVDRVQPEDFVRNQITHKGEYVHGIFNFSDREKYQPSEGQAIIYNGGNCYLFTGLTSIGSDDSTIGFILVDMVTKESHFYQMSGATEEAAQRSAEGKVQHLGYEATFPIILNVDGQPTYFMTLKDKSGLVKQYSMVSVINYNTVGVGETIQDALLDYRRGLQNDGTQLDEGTISDTTKETTAAVTRFSPEIVEGSTVYKFMVGGSEKIFVAESSQSQKLALTAVGDQVHVVYLDSEDGICTVTEFENLSIGQ